jgi:serpin B
VLVDPVHGDGEGATRREAAPRAAPHGGTEGDASTPFDAMPSVLSSAALIQLGRSTFRFGLALHQTLARDPEWAARNVVISPCSLSAAFGMIYAGARGETAREIAATLHYDLEERELHVGWARLRAALAELDTPAASGAPVQFVVANSLWADARMNLASDYKTVVSQHYGGTVAALDFAHAPEEARGRINGWVNERTRGLVPELFPSGSLGASTPLVVVNTAYLRGAWEEPFPRAETRPEPFEKWNGRRTDVPTMHGVLNAGYVETSDYQATELRYVGDRLSLILILPARGNFAAVEQGLNAASLTQLADALPQARRRVRVSLPKFAISVPFSLASTLAQLGMRRAFRAGADLGGMVTSDAPALFLGQVRHHVHLAMDEEQTEAAAGTGVVITYGAAPAEATFRVDRPFLLGIHDRKTGMLLFFGRVVDLGSGT